MPRWCVQPDQAGVEAEPAFEVRRRARLLRVRLDQGGINVEHQAGPVPAASAYRRNLMAGLRAQQPRPLPRHRRA